MQCAVTTQRRRRMNAICMYILLFDVLTPSLATGTVIVSNRADRGGGPYGESSGQTHVRCRNVPTSKTDGGTDYRLPDSNSGTFTAFIVFPRTFAREREGERPNPIVSPFSRRKRKWSRWSHPCLCTCMHAFMHARAQ